LDQYLKIEEQFLQNLNGHKNEEDTTQAGE
jgi:hypothetical protein